MLQLTGNADAWVARLSPTDSRLLLCAWFRCVCLWAGCPVVREGTRLVEAVEAAARAGGGWPADTPAIQQAWADCSPGLAEWSSDIDDHHIPTPDVSFVWEMRALRLQGRAKSEAGQQLTPQAALLRCFQDGSLSEDGWRELLTAVPV